MTVTPDFLRDLAAAERLLTTSNIGWDAAMDAQYRAAAFEQLAGELEATQPHSGDDA